jgi:hypothetical protein
MRARVFRMPAQSGGHGTQAEGDEQLNRDPGTLLASRSLDRE